MDAATTPHYLTPNSLKWCPISSLPPDRHELTRILNLYRICFEAAVKAYRAPAVTLSAATSTTNSSGRYISAKMAKIQDAYQRMREKI